MLQHTESAVSQAMFGLGPTELIIILAIVIVIFGAGKLPGVGKAFGETIRNFRTAKEGDDETPAAARIEKKPAKAEG